MFCSIIIPTRERPAQLARCLDALTRLEYPRDRFEVIVVDDEGGASLPSLRQIDRSIELTTMAQAHAGPSAARNLGATIARGELLVFVDDDCVPTPNWLPRLVDHAIRHPGYALGGRTLNGVTGNVYSEASQLIVEVGYVKNNPNPEAAAWFACNNLAVPAHGFHAIGGYDPRLRTGEDSDLCDRWRMAGFRMAYAPDALLFHHHDLDLPGFCRQHFANGRGLVSFRRAYHQRRGTRRPVEPSYYLALARAALQGERGTSGVGLLVRVVLAQVVNAAGFFHEWQRQAVRRVAGRRRTEARGAAA